MVNTCVVVGCNFSYSKRKIQGKEHVSVHMFPKRKEIRDAWIKAICRENWSPTNASSVCSQHFREEDMDLTGQTRRLREGAVPSLFPWDPSYHLKTNTATKHPICQGAGDETLKVSSNSSSGCDETGVEDLSPHKEKLTGELKEDKILLPSYPSYNQKMLTSVNVPVHECASDKTSQVSSNSSSSCCHKPNIADMSPRERKLMEELRKTNLQLIRAKRKIKVLQQKVRRREKKIQMDKEVIDELLKTEIINDYNAVLCSYTNDNVCK